VKIGRTNERAKENWIGRKTQKEKKGRKREIMNLK
jgi:hypothetical protein